MRTASLVLWVWLLTSPTQAQSPFDAVLERDRAADYTGALAALAELELNENANLETTDLRRFYLMRANYALTLGDDALASTTLRELAGVAPDFEGGSSDFRPELWEAFERARRDPIRLFFEVTANRVGDGVDFVLRHEGPGRPRIRYAVDGAEWSETSSNVHVVLGPGATLRYFATLIGPAGSVLRRVASSDSPRELTLPRAIDASRVELATNQPTEPVDREPEGRPRVRRALITIAVLLVVGAVLTAVLLTMLPRDTVLGPPQV